MSSDVENRLRQIVADTLGANVEEINDSSSSATLAAWDSYHHLMVMSAVEESFGITLSMEEITGVANFGDLRQTVSRHVSET